ncbi:MAG: GIY-YIG nuclease family protein [Saprospiraceae bacterium]|jgi:putative endonuclease|nr:GIY-YIG nuclease family protein [Saprospiraceae bacterium]MBK6391701.1 GIY-YIG nuclease family protein [Saprospiraceae bacterium]MBK6478459.1 GIY-YIG nuclease family protein [Saprospiraceae bacterium]MBK6813956.1 GIY-YIG nuclease family protein [Saprospiraceae bacterium]MBK7437065.1 GIY-YIG nuclease family protein [Saprospiraceae bacterium]
MHWVYILYSQKADKHYIGETEDLSTRLYQHNTHYFNTSYTTQAVDWVVVWSFNMTTRSKARMVESFLKKQKSKQFIIRFLNSSDLQHDIIAKFT